MDYRALLIAPLAALVLSVNAAPPMALPDGWTPYNDFEANLFRSSQAYDIGIDTAMQGSAPCLTVRSNVAQSKEGFTKVGHVYQTVTGYPGQRVRFSGQLRAEAASTWAGLYLGLGDGNLITPVTMGAPGVEKHLPVGATVPAADGQWHEVSVVLDVPADDPFLTLGLAQVGEGQVWVRNLKFEVVGPEVATTTTPVAIDWARGRRVANAGREAFANLPPQPLRNAALD